MIVKTSHRGIIGPGDFHRDPPYREAAVRFVGAVEQGLVVRCTDETATFRKMLAAQVLALVHWATHVVEMKVGGVEKQSTQESSGYV